MICIKMLSTESRCYKTGKCPVCRCVRPPFSPEIFQSDTVKGLNRTAPFIKSLLGASVLVQPNPFFWLTMLSTEQRAYQKSDPGGDHYYVGCLGQTCTSLPVWLISDHCRIMVREYQPNINERKPLSKWYGRILMAKKMASRPGNT